MGTYTLIKNSTELRELAGDLQKESAIGVDLEADSLFHYQEKVCLLQIATRTLNFLVDPLSVKDLSPLAPVFANKRILKVFHGADYDIRSLYRDFGIQVHSLFDTQIAARFLGLRETGLASLLQKTFGIESDKKYQKKDWSQRPLPAAMLHYAVQDINHLLPLADILQKELTEKGLLFCVREECDILTNVRPKPSDNGPLFLNFKGAAKLDRRSLAILEHILRFRDQVAKRRDRPHFKVLGNSTIMEIAQSEPLTTADLSGIKGLSPRQIENMGQLLVEKVKEGLHLSEDALPVFPRKARQRLSSKETARVNALKRWRKKLGYTWGVDPPVLCTNAQIQALAVANPGAPEGMESIAVMKKWQIKLLGAELCELLRGLDEGRKPGAKPMK